MLIAVACLPLSRSFGPHINLGTRADRRGLKAPATWKRVPAGRLSPRLEATQPAVQPSPSPSIPPIPSPTSPSSSPSLSPSSSSNSERLDVVAASPANTTENATRGVFGLNVTSLARNVTSAKTEKEKAAQKAAKKVRSRLNVTSHSAHHSPRPPTQTTTHDP